MQVIGVHRDGDYGRMAVLHVRGRRFTILSLSECKRDLLKKGLTGRVVSGLGPDEVFVRKLTFPFTKKRAIRKALPFQLEKAMPFSEEHVTTVPDIVGNEATLYTFFHETMQSHVRDIKELGFDTDQVTTVARALLQFKKRFVAEERVLLVYVGWEKTYLVYVHNQEIRESLAVEGGFDSPSAEYYKQIGRSLTYLKRKEGLDRLYGVQLGYTLPFNEICFLELKPYLDVDAGRLRLYAIEIGLALETLQLRRGLSLREKKSLTTLKRMFVGSLVAAVVAVGLVALSLQYANHAVDLVSLEKRVLLQGEKRVESTYEPLQERMRFLEENRIRFVKKGELWTLEKPVEADKEDVQAIVSCLFFLYK